MNIRAIYAIAVVMLVVAPRCSLAGPQQATPTARPPLSVLIYLCTRTTTISGPIPGAWRDPGHRMPKREPVYRSEAWTNTWIEIYLPKHKLAVHYGREAFFEANEVRYRPTLEGVTTTVGAGSLKAGDRHPPETSTRTQTGAEKLTDFRLTDDALARLWKALEKHLKSKEKTQPKQHRAQPSAKDDQVLLPPFHSKGTGRPFALKRPVLQPVFVPMPLVAQAKATGIKFEFASDRQEYSVGDPVTVTVHATNRSNYDVLLRPHSTYPSLFDFGILDNGKHIPYTVNMAINSKGKIVRVPAKSKILWAKENIVETTKAGDGSSAISAKGKHVLSFGTGNSVEITVK